MSLHVTRRIRPDGLTVLLPRDHRVERPEWYMAGFSVLLAAWALFVSTAIPVHVLGAVLLGLALGEVCFAIRAVFDLRHPRAEVVSFARSSRRR